MTTPSHFDPAQLTNLRSLIGDPAVKDLVALFHNLTRERIAALRTAVAAGDSTATRATAHALKSGAGQLGATHLQQLAAQIEQMATAGTLEMLPPLLQAIADEYATLAPLLDGAAPDAPPLAAPAAGPAANPPPSRAQSRIMIVEDNPDNRLLLRVLLAPHYAVSEFTDGDSALAALDATAPDLVILDISLPGMDGEELLTRMRAHDRWRTLPTIAFTAHAMVGDREHFLQAGFNGYIAKPITDEKILFTAIRELLPAQS